MENHSFTARDLEVKFEAGDKENAAQDAINRLDKNPLAEKDELQQHSSSTQRQQRGSSKQPASTQVVQERGKERKEQGEREAVWRWKSKEAEEERRRLVKRKVAKDAMDARAQQEEETDVRSRTIQIFVKVDGTKTVTMEVSLNDKVHDVMKKIMNTASGSDQDLYAKSDGRVLRRSEELGNCGVRDGSTVQIVRRLRGGGKHKDNNRNGSTKKERTEHESISKKKRLRSSRRIQRNRWRTTT